jgi:hypothetical protein
MATYSYKADIFSIIGRRMRCQSEFHGPMALVLVVQTNATGSIFINFYLGVGIRKGKRDRGHKDLMFMASSLNLFKPISNNSAYSTVSPLRGFI